MAEQYLYFNQEGKSGMWNEQRAFNAEQFLFNAEDFIQYCVKP